MFESIPAGNLEVNNFRILLQGSIELVDDPTDLGRGFRRQLRGELVDAGKQTDYICFADTTGGQLAGIATALISYLDPKLLSSYSRTRHGAYQNISEHEKSRNEFVTTSEIMGRVKASEVIKSFYVLASCVRHSKFWKIPVSDRKLIFEALNDAYVLFSHLGDELDYHRKEAKLGKRTI